VEPERLTDIDARAVEKFVAARCRAVRPATVNKDLRTLLSAAFPIPTFFRFVLRPLFEAPLPLFCVEESGHRQRVALGKEVSLSIWFVSGKTGWNATYWW